MAEGEKGNINKTASSVQGKARTKPTGRKGGSIFPRISLEEALKYSKKLVSKTAIGPQPEQTILAGVFGSSSGPGKIRLSALKQFGLLNGTVAGYRATQLAKDIEAAPDETAKKTLLARAMLSPKVYREIFNTYHGDLATKAQIRNRALGIDVHPDAGDTCTDLFIASVLTAGMGTAEADNVRLISATETESATPELRDEDGEEADIIDADDPDPAASIQEEKAKEDSPPSNSQASGQDDAGSAARPRQRVADVTLNLTVDSSLDGEKLEKQLALLRRFGLI